MTRAETLQLATPDEVHNALGLIGIDWRIHDGAESSPRDLYTWVCGDPEPGAGSDPRGRGILYVGIDDGVVGSRTAREANWRGGWHAHGLAIERANADVVIGAVRPADGFDAVLTGAAERLRGTANENDHDAIPGRLETIARHVEQGTLAQAAERIAVRLCIHLGTIGAAVNSQFASAWEITGALRYYDDIAYWLAQHLRARGA